MTLQELYASIDGDYDAALKVLQMDKMIERFITKLEKDSSCGALVEAWGQGDARGVFEASHALKGVCANLGLLSLSAAAGEICDEFREGGSRSFTDDEVTEKIDAIRAQYEDSVQKISAYMNPA